ncbi:MAG: MGMT family protein [Chloroflexi bacterium]|nr:MGMT family protein [Chloroflexota bacterium]
MYSPPDPRAYNARIYEIVRLIPPGRAVSYGQLAAMIPPPPGVDPLQYDRLGPRWAGSAMAGCPDDVPWQRVINGEGKISVRKNSTGHLLQRALLEAEGVEFDAEGRVEWERFEWDGPPEEWQRERGLRPMPRKSPPRIRRRSGGEQLSLL